MGAFARFPCDVGNGLGKKVPLYEHYSFVFTDVIKEGIHFTYRFLQLKCLFHVIGCAEDVFKLVKCCVIEAVSLFGAV